MPPNSRSSFPEWHAEVVCVSEFASLAQDYLASRPINQAGEGRSACLRQENLGDFNWLSLKPPQAPLFSRGLRADHEGLKPWSARAMVVVDHVLPER